MAKDFDSNSDINTDNKDDVNSDTVSDYGGDMASVAGIDLNMANRQQDIPANALSMSKNKSWMERLGAGMSAFGAIASPIHSQYAQMENMNGHDAPANYAIVQEYNNPNQQVDVELAQFAELQEMESRERNREASEINSVLNNPMSADNCDLPEAEPIDMPLDDLTTADNCDLPEAEPIDMPLDDLTTEDNCDPPEAEPIDMPLDDLNTEDKS